MSNKIIFDGLEEYLQVLKKLEGVARKKGHDYGGDEFLGALESSLGLGVKASLSCLLRADQKWSRVKNLVKNGEHTARVDESIDETVSDMINYLIYVLVLRTKEKLDEANSRQEAWEMSAEGAAYLQWRAEDVAAQVGEPVTGYYEPGPETHDDESTDGRPSTGKFKSVFDVVGEPVFDEDYPDGHPRPCPVCTLSGSPIYLIPRYGTKSWFSCGNCRREFNERGQQIVELAKVDSRIVAK